MPKTGIIAALEITPQGIACPESWVQVSRAEGNAQTIQFDANFYASEQAFDADALPLLTRSFTIPYQSGDLVTILHAHLLTLNLDDASNPNPYSRLRCNLTAGTLVHRADSDTNPASETTSPSNPDEDTSDENAGNHADDNNNPDEPSDGQTSNVNPEAETGDGANEASDAQTSDVNPDAEMSGDGTNEPSDAQPADNSDAETGGETAEDPSANTGETAPVENTAPSDTQANG